MKEDDEGRALPALPRDLSDRMFALLFGDPAGREQAFAELLTGHPAHAAALHAQWQRHLRLEQSVPPSEIEHGHSIPGFRLLAVLGEGGMGTVYRAEQQEPHRSVAMKVIKQGMDSKMVLARFEQERQALAAMDHDAIAKVFDCGTSTRGQPYFAMELVDGSPIHRYCDERRLPLRTRIELFVQVCQGVQHAHQKGVIHRDLKPGNVLVADQEGRHAVKIIDFGVARATDRRLSAGSFFTEQGMIVGTPEYMSPEQAAGDPRRVDTRSDIYSLGVILYELLVGALPFPAAELRAAGFAEIERRLRDDEPPKPSTRLSAMGREGTTCASLRQVSVEGLRRELAGDLDWVVQKAMAKEPARRYESATALAEDLQRYLAHEPLKAGPPSAGYRLRKLVRRYRGQVLAGGAVVAALVGGGLGTFVQYLRAEDRAADALQQKAKVEASERIAVLRAEENAKLAQEKTALAAAEGEARLAAQRSAAEAEQRARELEQVLAFQEAQWEEVVSESLGVYLRRGLLANAKQDRRADVEAGLAGVNFTSLALGALQRNLFDRWLGAIDRGFAEQPLVKARLLQSMAVSLRELGLLQAAASPQAAALEIRRRILGDDHRDTAGSMHGMGRLLQEQGQFAEAEPLLRAALATCRRQLGDEDPITLAANGSLGVLLVAQGRLQEAEPIFREVLAKERRILGEDDPRTLLSIHNMGFLLDQLGGWAEAESLFREALATQRRVLGDDHPDTLASMQNLANALGARGDLAEAESLGDEALERRRRVLGDDHPNTLVSMASTGKLREARGEPVEAERLYRAAMVGLRRILGDDHVTTLSAIHYLGSLLLAQGRLAEAEPLCREVLVARRRIHGGEHPDTLRSTSQLGLLLKNQGKLADAEPLYREVLAQRRRLHGDDHAQTLPAIHNLAVLLLEQDKPAEAEPLVDEALERCRRMLGDDHPNTWNCIAVLGSLRVMQGRLDEAESCCREVLVRRRQKLGEEHASTLLAVRHLGGVLVRRGQHDDAVALLAAAEAAARKVFTGGNAEQLAVLLQNLGKAQASSMQPADFVSAEARLLEAHTIFEGLRGPTHKNTRDCVQSLGDLHAAWHAVEPGKGHDLQAAAWRAKLAPGPAGR